MTPILAISENLDGSASAALYFGPIPRDAQRSIRERVEITEEQAKAPVAEILRTVLASRPSPAPDAAPPRIDPDTKRGALLAQRLIEGIHTLPPPVRVQVLAEIHGAFCRKCGGASSGCCGHSTMQAAG